jgi:hypothetical protein
LNSKLGQLIACTQDSVILPFLKHRFRAARLPANFDAQTRDEERKLGSSFTIRVHTHLLRKSDDYTVTVQDVKEQMSLKQSEVCEKNRRNDSGCAC